MKQKHRLFPIILRVDVNECQVPTNLHSSEQKTTLAQLRHGTGATVSCEHSAQCVAQRLMRMDSTAGLSAMMTSPTPISLAATEWRPLDGCKKYSPLKHCSDLTVNLSFIYRMTKQLVHKVVQASKQRLRSIIWT